MNLTLIGKTALVCGSSQGMGKAIAKQLSEQGANIVLLARSREKLEAVQKELKKVEETIAGMIKKKEKGLCMPPVR